MGFKALTVNTPPETEAHILAEDDAALYAGMLAQDSVLNLGSKLKATVTSNNKVRISDGVVLVGGHAGRIIKGDYEDMTINNGVSGQKRNDIIAARFIAGADGGADSYKLVVIQGTPGYMASDPVYVKGDLYNGDKQRDYPLWRVKIENLSIVKVEQMFTVGKSTEEVMAEMLAANAALQKQIAAKGQEASIGGYTREWLLTGDYQAIGNYAQTVNNEYFESTSGPDGYLKVKQSGVYLISLQANLRKKAQDSSGNVWSKIVVNDTGNIGGDVHYMPPGTYYDTVNYVTYNYLNAGAKLKAQLSVDEGLQGVWAQGGEYLNVVKLS